MHVVIADIEQDVLCRRDRDMHSYPVKPMVIDIYVRRYLAAGFEAHKPRATEYFAERRHYLLDIRTPLQRWRGLHRAMHCVVEFTVQRDQRN